MLRTLLFLPLTTLLLVAQDTATPAQPAAPPKPVAPKPAAPKPAAPKPGAKAAVKSAAPKDTVLARINGKPVLESEFMTFLDMAYGPQQRMQLAMTEGAIQQVQEQYIQTRLFEAKARKDGLDKTPAFAQKRAMMETDILVRALFERDGPKLQEKIKVSDADVKAFYDGTPDKLRTAETLNARHILVSEKVGEGAEAKTLTDEDMKAKVAKVQEALKGGRTFEEVAKEFSDDPGSKDKGGLYENITFGSFVPEFEAAVRAQKIGEVGQPVKTPFGYHIIQVEKLTPSELEAFDTVKEKARQLAVQANQEKVMSELVASIKREIPFVKGSGPATKIPKPAGN